MHLGRFQRDIGLYNNAKKNFHYYNLNMMTGKSITISSFECHGNDLFYFIIGRCDLLVLLERL